MLAYAVEVNSFNENINAINAINNNNEGYMFHLFTIRPKMSNV
jgi:hypothetical protein